MECMATYVMTSYSALYDYPTVSTYFLQKKIVFYLEIYYGFIKNVYMKMSIKKDTHSLSLHIV